MGNQSIERREETLKSQVDSADGGLEGYANIGETPVAIKLIKVKEVIKSPKIPKGHVIFGIVVSSCGRRSRRKDWNCIHLCAY